jgi:ABC-type multidrug transport system fused ATPase/permease subunit
MYHSLRKVCKTKKIEIFRLSTIRSADTIVALKDGRVAEMGTHGELMKARGLYFQLVTAQVRTF